MGASFKWTFNPPSLEDLENAIKEWPKVVVGAVAVVVNKLKCAAVPPALWIPLEVLDKMATKHGPGASKLTDVDSEFNTDLWPVLFVYVQLAASLGYGNWTGNWSSCRLHQELPFDIGKANQLNGNRQTNCIRLVTDNWIYSLRSAYPIAPSQSEGRCK